MEMINNIIIDFVFILSFLNTNFEILLILFLINFNYDFSYNKLLFSKSVKVDIIIRSVSIKVKLPTIHKLLSFHKMDNRIIKIYNFEYYI